MSMERRAGSSTCARNPNSLVQPVACDLIETRCDHGPERDLKRSLRASLTRDDAWQTRTVVDEMQKQSLARTDKFRAVGGRPRSSFEYAEVNPYAIATKVGPIGLARALSVLIEIITEALGSCFDAFSSREPVSTSLENAIGIVSDTPLRAVCRPPKRMRIHAAAR